jgi:hypothetical protein
VGRLVYLFSAAKFTEQFPRLIQNVLGFYRKQVDHLYVSETLNSVVLLAHQWNVAQLKVSMDIILRDVLNEVREGLLEETRKTDSRFSRRSKIITKRLKMETNRQ